MISKTAEITGLIITSAAEAAVVIGLGLAPILALIYAIALAFGRRWRD